MPRPAKCWSVIGCQQTLAEEFQWQALPAIQLKGKRAPTSVYRLLAEAPAAPTTLRQNATATEIIGRAAERTILADALVALMGGTSGIVVIDGEAGIGKSRLIAELAQMLQQRSIVQLIGSGQSIELISYSAWRDIFTSYFGLADVSDLAEREARVRSSGCGDNSRSDRAPTAAQRGVESEASRYRPHALA